MTHFTLHGKVNQLITLKSGDQKTIQMDAEFIIEVDLKSGKAWYRGVNKTPFGPKGKCPQAILDVLKAEEA